MSEQDWLSLAEIARRWGAETGESAEALERDLAAWFAAFVERPASAAALQDNRPGQSTDRLMGLLGGRQLSRETLALFCDERGRAKPRFWFAEDDEGDTDDTDDTSSSDGASDSASGEAPDNGSEGAPDGAPDGASDGRASARALRLAGGRLMGGKSARLAGGVTLGGVLGLVLLAGGYALWPAGGEPAASGPAAASEPASAALVRALRGELSAARREIDRLDAAFAASQAEVQQLTSDLQIALQDIDYPKQVSPSTSGEPGPVGAAPPPQSPEVELVAARHRIAELERDARQAQMELDLLASELNAVRARQGATPPSAGAPGAPPRRDLVLAAQAAVAEAARSRQDLAAAQARRARAEAEARTARSEAARLAGELAETRAHFAAADAATAATAATTATTATTATAENAPPRREPAPAAPAAQPEPTAAAGATGATEPTDRTAATGTTEAPASSAPPQRIDVDSLVADPGRFDTRRVVVTGSLLRLLQHYRLQSESGVRTLVVEVDGLDRDQHRKLRDAIAGAGLVGSVRARISGTVARGGAQAYRLIASDVALVE
jgi:chemotaxis protein histidine kinase CheA